MYQFYLFIYFFQTLGSRSTLRCRMHTSTAFNSRVSAPAAVSPPTTGGQRENCVMTAVTPEIVLPVDDNKVPRASSTAAAAGGVAFGSHTHTHTHRSVIPKSLSTAAGSVAAPTSTAHHINIEKQGDRLTLVVRACFSLAIVSCIITYNSQRQ